jgi:hypothetical protein
MPQASCGGCTATWTGVALAHCGTCHESFSGAWTFDQHRKMGSNEEHGSCTDPETMPSLEQRESGTWHRRVGEHETKRNEVFSH